MQTDKQKKVTTALLVAAGSITAAMAFLVTSIQPQASLVSTSSTKSAPTAPSIGQPNPDEKSGDVSLPPSVPVANVKDVCNCSCGEGNDEDQSVIDLCTYQPKKTENECTDTDYNDPNITTKAACAERNGKACKGYRLFFSGGAPVQHYWVPSEGKLHECKILAVPVSH